MAKDSGSRPEYTVCRVLNNGTLEVVDGCGSVSARTQEHACDQAVASLPPQSRHGTFAAFLRGSYREFDYTSEQQFVTSKTPREKPTWTEPLFERPLTNSPGQPESRTPVEVMPGA
jgi:hypothetical protein